MTQTRKAAGETPDNGGMTAPMISTGNTSMAMTAADFKAWRAGRGWSLARAARELGRAENSIIAYERNGDIPKTVVLAMEALDMRDRLADLTMAVGVGNANRIVAEATKLVRNGRAADG